MNRYPGGKSFGQASDWLMRTAKANPEALLVLAAGCALLLRSSGGARADSSHRQVYRYSDFDRQDDRDASRWRDGLSGAGEKVGAYASDVKNRVTDTAGAYASSLSGYAGQVQRNVADQASSLSDYAGEVGRSISDQASAVSGYAAEMGRNVSHQAAHYTDAARAGMQSGYGYVLREQPLAIAVLGVAAGAALAAMFPPTEAEARALGPAGKAIADTAAKVRENIMDAAGEAGARLKQQAAERGLSTEGLKEMAQDVAGTFASKATTGAAPDRAAAETGANAQPSRAGAGAGMNPQPNRGSQ